MAERKAVNKYYPPDWDPRKGSVNKRVGQHPLRDRARKLGQGILVIRFELPYNIWCGGCGIHVGMGVRYNAEKSKVGNYYSTPIYKFRMKCHLCDNYFEIQTDPKNHDYVILSGARRKEQRWDPVANEQIVPEDKATQKKLATDPMYKLEHGSDDHSKGKQQTTSLADLEETRISMIDDYILNRMARDKFRTEKHQLREAAEADQAILDKSSLDIELVEETDNDRKLAGLLKYSVTKSFDDKQKERRKSIDQRPLFSEEKSGSLSTSSSSSSSSSSHPSTLPHQRPLRQPSSRRGEIKHKLGLALKASATDPFKTQSKAGSVKTVSPSLSLQKQLGIKLKQKPPSSTLPCPKVGRNKETEASLCHPKSSSGLPKREWHETDKIVPLAASPSANTTADSTPVNVASTDDLTVVDKSSIACEVDVSEAVSHDNSRVHEDQSKPNSNNSNSGLNALMCSYEASDSDSND